MQQEQVNDQSNGRRTWLIILVISLFALAIFWSVDPSVVYLLLGVIVFSLYKIIALRKSKPDDYEPSYRETYRQSKPSFWDEVKKMFDNPNAGYQNKQQKTQKLVSFIIAGSVGFIFFIIILSAVFSDNSPGSVELRQEASDFYNQEQFDSAVYYYSLAIEIDSENPEIYLERGNAYLYANKTDLAMSDYDRALELNPLYKEALYNKGLIYYNRKQYSNSISMLRKAIQADPTYGDAMAMIGDGFIIRANSIQHWCGTK